MMHNVSEKPPESEAGWLVEQGLTSHLTQFRSFRRRCFYRSDDPTNSVKALKEDGELSR